MNAITEPQNWLVALPVLGITVIQLVWGADLIVTSIIAAKRPREIVADGAFWLGAFFISESLFLTGAIGFLLLANPRGTTPLWFGVGMVIAAVAAILAWYVLTFQEIAHDE